MRQLYRLKSSHRLLSPFGYPFARSVLSVSGYFCPRGKLNNCVIRSSLVYITVALPQVPCCASCSIIENALSEESERHAVIPTPLDQLQALDSEGHFTTESVVVSPASLLGIDGKELHSTIEEDQRRPPCDYSGAIPTKITRRCGMLSPYSWCSYLSLIAALAIAMFQADRAGQALRRSETLSSRSTAASMSSQHLCLSGPAGL